MFDSPAIALKHGPSLHAAVMHHRSKADEGRVTRLYQATREIFYADKPPPALPPSFRHSRLAARTVSPTFEALDVVLATVTDLETGLFVQLTGAPNCPEQDLMLTFGQKYCLEGMDTAHSQIVTRLW